MSPTLPGSDELSALMPLRNKTILVASSPQKTTKLVAGLEDMGARVIAFPAIDIREITEIGPLDGAIDALEDYSWIIFTSSYGVEFFLRRMRERGIPLKRWKNPKVCAVGPATASTLIGAGIEVSLVPEEFMAEGVLRALAERHGGLEGLAGKRILLPRARQAREVLPNTLASAGARVDVVPCYENIVPELDPVLLTSVRGESIDLLVFTSASTVSNFVKLLGNKEGKSRLQRTTVAAIGPVTAGTLASLGKKVEILPREHTVAALLDAIARYYR